MFPGRQPVLGDLSERDPPVPIPNTEVKPLSPDGTARASVWESRKSPGYFDKGPISGSGLFSWAPHFTKARVIQPQTISNPAAPGLATGGKGTDDCGPTSPSTLCAFSRSGPPGPSCPCLPAAS